MFPVHIKRQVKLVKLFGNLFDKPQAVQTHVTREGCNVIYMRYRRPLKIKETLYEKYITEICER